MRWYQRSGRSGDEGHGDGAQRGQIAKVGLNADPQGECAGDQAKAKPKMSAMTVVPKVVIAATMSVKTSRGVRSR